ncbi:hypothetical protein SAMN05216226_11661 [Halovenus aranensis]|uniref:CDP-Glycerol:Poly(Glycerophosphate) glycerophosphotransferase n=1 Tax=Halovenus aranensis TaxID=890420 RepID=A0A1G8YVM2_9EURY|nr:hypothetical protein [Halovenus aranensis]SDK06899.1 hypothetical protein SAMN05216226_11661 [Halovenus aranensis]
MSEADVRYDDVSEFLFDLETRLDLSDWVVDDVPVWDYIRAPTHRKLFQVVSSSGDSESSTEGGVQTSLKGGYLWGRNIVLRNPFFGDCTVLSYGSSRRKQQDNGYWWDIYFDPLYEETNLDYLHVEKPYQNTHRTPPRTDNLKYIDFIQYSGVICEKLGLVDADFSNEDYELIADIETTITDTFGVSPDIKNLAKRRVIKAKIRKPLFDILIRRTNPELALLSCSYGKESFIWACKQNNVPVAELQHGVIHEYHPGYHYPGDSQKTLFPDYLLTFGEYWDECVSYPIDRDHIYPVGYPYLESESQQYTDVTENSQIIFISQPTIGPELSKFAAELSEREIGFDIVYKPHPAENNHWERKYPWLADSDITVVSDNSRPLYDLFASSTVQVGVYSTAIYEGLQFGLDTYLVDLAGLEVMEYLVEKEFATVVSSVDDLEKELGEGGATQFERSEYLFRSNAIDNITEEICRLRTGQDDSGR